MYFLYRSGVHRAAANPFPTHHDCVCAVGLKMGENPSSKSIILHHGQIKCPHNQQLLGRTQAHMYK